MTIICLILYGGSIAPNLSIIWQSSRRNESMLRGNPVLFTIAWMQTGEQKITCALFVPRFPCLIHNV